LTNCFTLTRNTSTDMKLLFFRAEWCGPCRQMAPVIETIMDQDYFKERYSSVERIDVDADWESASHWVVRSLPTFIILDNHGQEVARHIGAWNREKMQEWMLDNYQYPSTTVSTTADHSPIPIKEKTMLTTIKRMLGLTQSDPIIGSIELWSGHMVPRLFARCEGQRMNIKGNEALFSIIGTTYGGDGQTYFNLPDYRPRDAKGNVQPWDAAKSPVVLICIYGQYPAWEY
jgi:hypothetical protein